MEWMGAKGLATVTIAALAILLLAFVAMRAVSEPPKDRIRRLSDGSMLVLNRVSFGETNEFVHGRFLERALGRAIPAKGIKVGPFQLARPTRRTFSCPPGKSQLVAELRLIGKNTANHPLVRPAFYREFRCVIRGQSGIEYVHEFATSRFQQYSDGFFGHVPTERYPRESRMLWLRVERRQRPDQGGPWAQVAEFKIDNGLGPVMQPWSAEPAGCVKTIDGLEIGLGQITVVTQAFSAMDIWNHVVTVPFQVKRNESVLTNWSAAYVRAEDASGNWDYNLASHRSLDPRYVWKLEADFEPGSGFQTEQLLTVNLPKPSSPVTVEHMNLPVTISWDGYMVEADMPTNRSDLALKFVCVTDQQGRRLSEGAGSWNQHGFRMGTFMYRDATGLSMVDSGFTSVTFAIVPNVHATFFAQPRLLNQ